MWASLYAAAGPPTSATPRAIPAVTMDEARRPEFPYLTTPPPPPAAAAAASSSVTLQPQPEQHARTIPCSPERVFTLPPLSHTATYGSVTPSTTAAAATGNMTGSAAAAATATAVTAGADSGAKRRQRIRQNAELLAASQRRPHGYGASTPPPPPSALYSTPSKSKSAAESGRRRNSLLSTHSVASSAGTVAPSASTVLLRHTFQGTTRILYADGHVETVTPADDAAAAAATAAPTANSGNAFFSMSSPASARKAAKKSKGRKVERSAHTNTTALTARSLEKSVRSGKAAPALPATQVVLPSYQAVAQVYDSAHDPFPAPPSSSTYPSRLPSCTETAPATPGTAATTAASFFTPALSANASTSKLFQEPWTSSPAVLPREAQTSPADALLDRDVDTTPSTHVPSSLTASASASASVKKDTTYGTERGDETDEEEEKEDTTTTDVTDASGVPSAHPSSQPYTSRLHLASLRPIGEDAQADVDGMPAGTEVSRGNVNDSCEESHDDTTAVFLTSVPAAVLPVQLEHTATLHGDHLLLENLTPSAEFVELIRAVQHDIRYEMASEQRARNDTFASRYERPVHDSPSIFSLYFPFRPLQDIYREGMQLSAASAATTAAGEAQGDSATHPEASSSTSAHPSASGTTIHHRSHHNSHNSNMRHSASHTPFTTAAAAAPLPPRGSATASPGATGVGGVPDILLSSAQSCTLMGWSVPELIQDRLLPREGPALQHRLRELLALRGIFDAPDTMTCRFCVAFIWFVLLRSRKVHREQTLVDGYRRLAKAFADTFPLSSKDTVPTLDVLGQLIVELNTCARYDEDDTDESGSANGEDGEDDDHHQSHIAVEGVPTPSFGKDVRFKKSTPQQTRNTAAATSSSPSSSAAAAAAAASAPSGAGAAARDSRPPQRDGPHFACLSELLVNKEFFPLLTGEWSYLLRTAHTAAPASSFSTPASPHGQHRQHAQPFSSVDSRDADRGGDISILPSSKALQTLCAVYQELWLMCTKYVEMCFYEEELYKQLAILFRNLCVQVSHAAAAPSTVAATSANVTNSSFSTANSGSAQRGRKAKMNSVLSVSGASSDEANQLSSHISVDMSLLTSASSLAGASAAKDTILDSLLIAVAHATYFTCVFCFPNDVYAGTFDDEFRTDIVQWLSYCCHGVVTTHVQTKHWPLPTQQDHDDAQQLRSAAQERELAALGLHTNRRYDTTAAAATTGVDGAKSSADNKRTGADGKERAEEAEEGVSGDGGFAVLRMSSAGSERTEHTRTGTASTVARPRSQMEGRLGGGGGAIPSATEADRPGNNFSGPFSAVSSGAFPSVTTTPTPRAATNTTSKTRSPKASPGAVLDSRKEESLDLENIVANAEFRLAHEFDRYSRAAAQHVSELERRMARLQRRHRLANYGGGAAQRRMRANSFASRRGSAVALSRATTSAAFNTDDDDLLGASLRSLTSVPSRLLSFRSPTMQQQQSSVGGGGGANQSKMEFGIRKERRTSLARDRSGAATNSTCDNVAPSFPLLDASSTALLQGVASIVDTSAYASTTGGGGGNGGSRGNLKKVNSQLRKANTSATNNHNNNNNNASDSNAVSWRSGSGAVRKASGSPTSRQEPRASRAANTPTNATTPSKSIIVQRGNATTSNNGNSGSGVGTTTATTMTGARADPRDLYRTSAFVENDKSLVVLAAELNQKALMTTTSTNTAASSGDVFGKLRGDAAAGGEGERGGVFGAAGLSSYSSAAGEEGENGDEARPRLSGGGARALPPSATSAASLLSSYPLATCSAAITEYWLTILLRASSWWVPCATTTATSATAQRKAVPEQVQQLQQRGNGGGGSPGFCLYVSPAAAALDSEETDGGAEGNATGEKRESRLCVLAHEPWRGLCGRVVAVPPISGAAQRAARLIDTLAESLPYQQSLVYNELRSQQAAQEESVMKVARGLSNLYGSNNLLFSSSDGGLQPFWNGLMELSALASPTSAAAAVASSPGALVVAQPRNSATPGVVLQASSAALPPLPLSPSSANAAVVAAAAAMARITPPNLGTATIPAVPPYTSGLENAFANAQSATGPSVASYLRRRGVGDTYQGCTSPFFQLYASTCLALTLSNAEVSLVRESLNVARDRRREEALSNHNHNASMRADNALNNNNNNNLSLLSSSLRLPAQQQDVLGQQVLSSLLPVPAALPASSLYAALAANTTTSTTAASTHSVVKNVGAAGARAAAGTTTASGQPLGGERSGLKNTQRGGTMSGVGAGRRTQQQQPQQQQPQGPQRFMSRSLGRGPNAAASAFAITAIPREEARLRPCRMKPLQDEALRRRTQLLADMDIIDKRDGVARQNYVVQQLRVANAMAHATSDAMLRRYRARGRLALERLAVEDTDQPLSRDGGE